MTEKREQKQIHVLSYRAGHSLTGKHTGHTGHLWRCHVAVLWEQPIRGRKEDTLVCWLLLISKGAPQGVNYSTLLGCAGKAALHLIWKLCEEPVSRSLWTWVLKLLLPEWA